MPKGNRLADYWYPVSCDAWLAAHLLCIKLHDAVSDWVSHTLLAVSTSRCSSCFPQAKTCILNWWTIKTFNIFPQVCTAPTDYKDQAALDPELSKVASLKTEVLHAKPAATKHAIVISALCVQLASFVAILTTRHVTCVVNTESDFLWLGKCSFAWYTIFPAWLTARYLSNNQTNTSSSDILTCLNLLENQRPFFTSCVFASCFSTLAINFVSDFHPFTAR